MEEILKEIKRTMKKEIINDSVSSEEWFSLGKPLILEEKYKDSNVAIFSDSGFGYLILVEKNLSTGEYEVYSSLESGVKGRNYAAFWNDLNSGICLYECKKVIK